MTMSRLLRWASYSHKLRDNPVRNHLQARGMRLSGFEVRNTVGLTHVQANGLSDVVVFAGPNGVGKTRLVERLRDFFRDPRPRPDIGITVEATSELETKAWGKNSLSTKDQGDCDRLRSVLQRNQKRNNYRSTILNFDSNRAITNIRPFDFAWSFPDPFEEDVGWDMSYGFLRDRFQDVQHSLFKLVESQRRKIADRAVELQKY